MKLSRSVRFSHIANWRILEEEAHIYVERVALEEEAQVRITHEHRMRHDLVECRLQADPAVLDKVGTETTCGRERGRSAKGRSTTEEVIVNEPIACFSGIPGTITPGLF